MAKEIDIDVPANVTPENVVATIDAAIAALGLNVALLASLKSFPGSTHWHLKRGREPGTLEITWWPSRRRLWIKIQAGRSAAWIGKTAPQLKELIQLRFSQPAHPAQSE
jgi:hypothetical protein